MNSKRLACLSLALAAVFTSVAHAEPSQRYILGRFSSVIEETLQRLEKQRGAAVRDDELKEVMGSDAFMQEYPKALADLCATHPKVMGCEQPGK
jgi:hypothetical protein